jgi:2-dehydro-3-deoxyphosphogluconate aldolase/(4S)-4-hydroxy-2-oxoglutarate aldolase
LKVRQWQKLLKQHKAIAVIRANDWEIGVKMAVAAARGGMRLIEITWNSQEPGKIIAQLRQALPDCIIGTGTILTLEQLQIAIAEGIEFCFMPHVNLEIIQAAIAAEIPIIPGALSPTEIVTAWQAGASCVKVFPVQALGGVSYLKSLQGPLGNIPLIPTGGVTLDNAKQFLTAGAIAVGLAGDLFPQSLITAQDWQAIENICVRLVNQIN